MSEKQVIEIGAKVDEALINFSKLSDSIGKLGDKINKMGSEAQSAAEKPLKTLSDRIKQVGDAADDMARKSGIAFAAISGFIGVAVKNYGEQERAINKLNTVLKNNGIYTDELSNKYVKLSSKMQEQSDFADEQVLSAIGTVQSYLGEIEVTEGLTKSILDLAQAKGMDLNSAAQLVGKSIGSDTNALARMGVAVDSTADKETKLAQVMEGLNALMGGQAEAASKDIFGAMNQAKMALGDVMELIGKQFVPMITNVALKIKEFAKALQENKEALDIGTEILGVTAAIAGLVMVTTKAVSVVASLALGFRALSLALSTHPIALAINAIAISISLLGAAWATDFGNIQEITTGTLSYLKTFIGSTIDTIIGYYKAFAQIAASALSLDMAGMKKGLEQWSAVNSNIIDDASKAYGKGYAEREKLNGKSLDKEVAKTEVAEKKKYKAFDQRLADEAKKRAETQKKEDESYQKFLTDKETASWDMVMNDNEAAMKAAKDLENGRLQYAYDRLSSEGLANANSISEIEQLHVNLDSSLLEIHQTKLKQIDEEKGVSLEAQKLKEKAEFEYYKARIDLQKKIDDKIKDAMKNTVPFYDKLLDRITAIASVIGSISSSIEGAAQYGKNVAGGAGIQSGATVTSDIATIPEKLNENIDAMYEAMLGAGDRFNSQLDKALTRLPDMVEAFAASFPKLAEAFANGIGPLMSAVFTSLMAMASVFVANLGKMLTSIFGTVIPDMIRRFPEMFAILLEGLNVAFAALLETLPIMITEFFGMLPELIMKINEAIPGFIATLAANFLPIAEALISGLVNAAPDLVMAWVEVSAAWALIGGLIAAAMAALAPVWATVGAWISAGMATLAYVWASIGLAIGAMVPAGIAAGLAVLYVLLGLLAAAAIGYLVKCLYDNWDAIKKFVTDIFSAIWEGLKEAAKIAWEGLKEAAKIAGEIIAYPFELLWKAVTTILQPLIDALKAISDTVSSITGSGKSGGVVNTVKDVFTPSKWKLKRNDGGMIPRYLAAGDFIPKGSDTVPAMLSPGEFVVNADATSKNLGTLRNINAGGNASMAEEIVLRIIGDDDFGRLVEKSLVKMSTLGTGRLRVAVGSEA